jgi:hypothetical protein
MRTDCDVCNQTGIGPDGSYCRTRDCFFADWRHWKDQATEMVNVLAVVDGYRIREGLAHQQTLRDLHELRFNFQKYGRHHRSCTKGKGTPCSCGFEKVRLEGIRW